MPASLSIAPTVQAIVGDGVAIVNPQFASIVGVNAETVMPSPENSYTASPSHSEVVTSAETRPIATCVAIVHNIFPALQPGSATVQVLTPTMEANCGLTIATPSTTMACTVGAIERLAGIFVLHGVS
jgi:hypothetical protein